MCFHSAGKNESSQNSTSPQVTCTAGTHAARRRNAVCKPSRIFTSVQVAEERLRIQRRRALFLGGHGMTVTFDPVVWMEGGASPMPAHLNDVGTRGIREKDTRSRCPRLSSSDKKNLYKFRRDLTPPSQNICVWRLFSFS